MACATSSFIRSSSVAPARRSSIPTTIRRSPPRPTNVPRLIVGGVRRMVVGMEDRRAGATELERMKELVAQAMEDGALGLSTSLQYVPDLYNSTEEIIACAKVAASRGGVYFTHQRSEGNRIEASLEEVFRICL